MKQMNLTVYSVGYITRQTGTLQCDCIYTLISERTEHTSCTVGSNGIKNAGFVSGKG